MAKLTLLCDQKQCIYNKSQWVNIPPDYGRNSIYTHTCSLPGIVDVLKLAERQSCVSEKKR